MSQSMEFTPLRTTAQEHSPGRRVAHPRSVRATEVCPHHTAAHPQGWHPTAALCTAGRSPGRNDVKVRARCQESFLLVMVMSWDPEENPHRDLPGSTAPKTGSSTPPTSQKRSPSVCPLCLGKYTWQSRPEASHV